MKKLLRISQIAKLTGKTNRALRYYEELGLLNPKERTTSGYRLYGENALLKIEWIDKLSELGFSLSEIQEFLSSFKEVGSGPDMMASLQTIYQKKLIEVNSSISRLQKLASELSESIAYTSGCQSCSPKTEVSHCKACSVHEEQTPLLVSVVAKSL